MSPLSFLIGAARFLAVFLWLALLVGAVSGAWTLTCWIAETRQRRRERAPRRHQTDHDDQTLYPTGEQQ
ncbi:hypothetical protein [Streptomyces sp. NPDC056670]|uniref:hypothetical protein n=1 Tax=Streptomyces sp. NPDC056670 TaxID=3345904 RepID=UPI0036873170